MSKAIIKTPATKLAVESPEAQAVARFAFCHRLAQVRGLQFKLAAYFAGMEIQTLASLHDVSQGKGAKNGEPWGSYVQRVLGIPYSTAQRYRAQYNSVATEHAKLASKLNDHWLKITSGKDAAKLLQSGDEAALAVELPASALQAICDHADEWGLNEIFLKPAAERDVTPEDEEDSGEGAKKRRAALQEFWNNQVLRRMATDEFLRLPKAQLETFATRAEEAAKKARAALAGKKGGK